MGSRRRASGSERCVGQSNGVSSDGYASSPRRKGGFHWARPADNLEIRQGTRIERSFQGVGATSLAGSRIR